MIARNVNIIPNSKQKPIGEEMKTKHVVIQNNKVFKDFRR